MRVPPAASPRSGANGIAAPATGVLDEDGASDGDDSSSVTTVSCYSSDSSESDWEDLSARMTGDKLQESDLTPREAPRLGSSTPSLINVPKTCLEDSKSDR